LQYVSVFDIPPSLYVTYENAAGACANVSTLIPWLQKVAAEPGTLFEPIKTDAATMS
jgi:hypothetical protein